MIHEFPFNKELLIIHYLELVWDSFIHVQPIWCVPLHLAPNVGLSLDLPPPIRVSLSCSCNCDACQPIKIITNLSLKFSKGGKKIDIFESYVITDNITIQAFNDHLITNNNLRYDDILQGLCDHPFIWFWELALFFILYLQVNGLITEPRMRYF